MSAIPERPAAWRGTHRATREGNTEDEFLHGVPVIGELGTGPSGVAAANPSNPEAVI